VTHEALKKRVERLEEEKMVDSTDFVMWWGPDGGIFGHAHVIGMNRKVPCSDEEEVEIMREQFEADKHRIWGRGEEVPFWKYLEAFTYLAPDGLAERQRAAIDKVKGS
jgi:hypothetical protein